MALLRHRDGSGQAIHRKTVLVASITSTLSFFLTNGIPIFLDRILQHSLWTERIVNQVLANGIHMKLLSRDSRTVP